MAGNLTIYIGAKDAAAPVLKALKGHLEQVDTAGAKSAGGIAKLGSALGGLGLAKMGLDAISGAAQGLAQSLGVGLASEAEQVAAKFNAFTKDSAKTAEIMALVRAEADKTPFSFQAMSAATAGLMSSAKQSGAALMDLVQQAEILAASNPAEGLEGAAFALREAVSGDFTSIIERFNLPRTYINQLKEEGVPALEIVSRAMGEMGYDLDLVSNLAATGAGKWSTFQDAVDGVRMVAAQPIFDALKEALDRLSVLFTKHRETLVKVAAVLGGVLATAIGIAVGALEGLAGWLETMQPQLQQVGAIVSSNLKPILASLAAVLLGVVVPAFVAWAGAAATAATATIIALAPVLVPLAAIGAAVFLLVKAWESNFGDIQGKAKAVWDFLNEHVFTPWGVLLDAFRTVTIPALQTAWETLTTTIRTVWQGVMDALTPALATLVTTWDTAHKGFETLVTTVWAAIKTLILDPWGAIETAVTTGLKTVGTAWDDTWKETKRVAETLWGDIKTEISTKAGEVRTAVETVLGAVKTAAADTWGDIKTAIPDAWSGIKTAASTAAGELATALGTKWTEIKTAVSTAWGEIARTITGAINGIVEPIRGTISSVVGLLAPVQSALDKISAWRPPAIPAAPAAPSSASGGGGSNFTSTGGASGQRDWGTYNFLVNTGTSPADAAKKAVFMQSGGWITEPILGVGLRTGTHYGLGEAGPELVTPANRLRTAPAGGGGGGGATIVLELDGVVLGRVLAPYLTEAQDRYTRIRVP